MDDVIERLEAGGVVEIDRDELDRLLARAATVRDDDTRLSGSIRVLVLGDVVVLQEETPRGVLLVRRLATVEDADRLVDDRLATYERMWDGCGCKVDYYR
jgi:hypothetical protein